MQDKGINMSNKTPLRLHFHGKGGYHVNSGRIHRAIRDHEDFTAGNMTGMSEPVTSFGRLDHDYRESVKSADYVVYSYSTPIAWHVPCGPAHNYWVIPDDTYSVTTSRHQNVVRVAVANEDVRLPT